MSRFWILPLILVLCVVTPFLIWGDVLTTLTTPDPETGRFAGTGMHAGLLGILMLVADLVLPIPTTSVMAGLGILYGPVIGTVWATLGAMAAASVGYALGRFLGRPFAQRWLGEQMATGERAFARHGGWIVAASRWLPILPEVVSVVAGVSRMPFPAFLAAAFCGALPHAAVFATLGHLGAAQPMWTLAISAVLPVLLWLVAERTGLAARLGLSARPGDQSGATDPGRSS